MPEKPRTHTNPNQNPRVSRNLQTPRHTPPRVTVPAAPPSKKSTDVDRSK